MSVIPLQESAEYLMRIDLEGIPNRLRVYWNEFSDAIKPSYDTAGFWAMDLSNELFTINGIKLVGGTELMLPYSQVNFGGFYLYDMANENLDPEFVGIGTRWQLNYIPLSEIVEFRRGLGVEAL